MADTIVWEEWGPPAFERARREKKQVLLRLTSASAGSKPLIDAALEDVVVRRFVTVSVEAEERPDVFLRHFAAARRGGHEALPAACILSDAGQLLHPRPDGAPEELEGGIHRLAASYEPGPKKGAEEPAWTGAVGGPPPKELDAALPKAMLEAVKKLPASSRGSLTWRLDAWRLLAYAGAEWKDAGALKSLEAELSAFVDPKLAWVDLLSLSDLTALCWEFFALTGSAAHGERAAAYTARLCESAGSPRYADAAARSVCALLRAADFPGQQRCHDAVEQLLHQLRSKMYDPVLGMIHARTPKAVVYGLLQDNAWALLAFTEAFLATGHKPYRETADELGRLLFQEYWDRDSGGFLDRAPQHGDIGLMKEKRRPVDLNALALEGVWRLSELKGNANYKKWVKMALQGLAPDPGQPELHAGLARVQALLADGRMDFELVGLLSDPKTDALLSALSRHSLPRKIVSFVDPNDQDYILAHKLQAEAYPRLFACGPNLKRLADTDDPAKVAELVRAHRGGD